MAEPKQDLLVSTLRWNKPPHDPQQNHNKAECLLLETNGRYFYGEGFQQWIEIEKPEYEMIQKNAKLYYFSTALKMHFEWNIARREGATLTYAEATESEPKH